MISLLSHALTKLFSVGRIHQTVPLGCPQMRQGSGTLAGATAAWPSRANAA